MNAFRTRFASFLAALLVAWSAQGAEQLAVLDVDAAPKDASDKEVAFLTDALRQASASALGSRLRVMTRETIVETLPPAMLRCGRDECLASIGRKLQATYVLGGTLRKAGGNLALSLEAHESASGKLLGAKALRGVTVTKLVEAIEKEADDLVGEWIGSHLDQKLAAQEKKLGGDSTDFALAASDEAVIEFSSEPAGAAVTLDGQPLCPVTPCTRKVKKGPHDVAMNLEWYLPASQNFVAAQRATVTQKLEPDFGTLDLITDPPGAKVTIDGQAIGYTPIDGWKLRQGKHTIELSDKCLTTIRREEAVVRGGQAKLVTSLAPLTSEAVVESYAEGTVVASMVFVDGVEAGPTPGRFTIPSCAKELRVVPSSPGIDAWVTRLEGEAGTTRTIRAEHSVEEAEARRAAWLAANDNDWKQVAERWGAGWTPRVSSIVGRDGSGFNVTLAQFSSPHGWTVTWPFAGQTFEYIADVRRHAAVGLGGFGYRTTFGSGTSVHARTYLDWRREKASSGGEGFAISAEFGAGLCSGLFEAASRESVLKFSPRLGALPLGTIGSAMFTLVALGIAAAAGTPIWDASEWTGASGYAGGFELSIGQYWPGTFASGFNAGVRFDMPRGAFFFVGLGP